MNLIKKILINGLSVVSLNAFAQAPAPAAMLLDSAEQNAAVTEMLEAMNLKQTMSQMAAAMTQSMPQMLEQLTARMSDKLPQAEQVKARERAKNGAASSMTEMNAIYNDPAFIKGMEDIMARAYSKRFTTSEIKYVTAFYKSDAGKKMLTTAPQLMQETMPEVMALIRPRMNAIIEKTAKQAIEQAEKSAVTAR